jgi:hypothetical protein
MAAALSIWFSSASMQELKECENTDSRFILGAKSELNGRFFDLHPATSRKPNIG